MTCIDDYTSKMYFQLVRYTDPYNNIKFIAEWSDLLDRIYEQYRPYLQGDRIAKNRAKDLITDESDPTRQLEVIYNFVWDSIDTGESKGFLGIGLQSVRTTLKDRQGSRGNKNLLLLTMLREIGIDARPVVISTRSHGRIYTRIPRLRSFNHTIVLSRINNKNYFMDTADPFCPLGMLPPNDITDYGFLITDDAFKVIKLPKQNSSSMYLAESHSAELKETGELTVNQTLRFEGYRNRNYRSLLAHSDSPEVFAEKYILGDLTNVTLDSLKIANLEDIMMPLTVHIQYTIQNFANIIGNHIYFAPALVQRLTENPFQLENRTYPIEFAYPHIDQATVNIKLPENCAISELPQDRTLDVHGLQFQRQFSIDGNTLQYQRRFYVSQTKLSERFYQDVKDLYSQIVQADQDQVVGTLQESK